MLVHPQKLKVRFFLPFGSWLALSVSLLVSRQFTPLTSFSSVDAIIRVTMSVKAALLVAVMGVCSTMGSGSTHSTISDGLMAQTAPGPVVASAVPVLSTVTSQADEARGLNSQRRARTACPGTKPSHVYIDKDDRTDEGWVCLDSRPTNPNKNPKHGKASHVMDTREVDDGDCISVSRMMTPRPAATPLLERDSHQISKGYPPASRLPLPESVISRLATTNPPAPTPEAKAEAPPSHQHIEPLSTLGRGGVIHVRPTTLVTKAKPSPT